VPLTYRFYRYDILGSTNDEALRLAALGEPEGAVVMADTQTAGRGRLGRQWITPRGTALAMTLLLRPQLAVAHTTQIALLGGLAVLEGVQQVTTLTPQLKWPNDVLVHGKKVAGVLAESGFLGNKLEHVALGMGVNINSGPPPNLVTEYPATSLAAEYGASLDREAIAQAILAAFAKYYPQLGTPALSQAWSAHLAMRGQQVRLVGPTETTSGELTGVREDGALILKLKSGKTRTFVAGDLHLRDV
jgi:BirA family biotin operon repressor/biotin-[acetyl-CoA-carboxylase] ligase